MPVKLAKKITLTETEWGGMLIEVDGNEFPWYLAHEELVVRVEPGGMATVNMPLLAERIEFIPLKEKQ